GWIEGDCLQDLLVRNAAAHGGRGGAKKDSRVGDEIVRVDGQLDARLVKDGCALFDNRRGLQLASWTIDQRKAAWNMMLGELWGHAVTFGDVVQDELKTELLGDSHRGHEIIGAVAVKVDGSLAIEHLHQRLHGQVSLRHRLWFLSRIMGFLVR